MLGEARRRTAALVATALLLAACGTASHSATKGTTPAGGVSPAEAAELSYIAPGAPFVITVATSGSGAAGGVQSYLNANPQASSILALAKTRLAQLGIDFSRDVKPLLGNPVMIGTGAATLTGANKQSVVFVWTTRSATALAGLLGKVPGLTSTAGYDGAKLYALGTQAELAVSGATAVVATSLPLVRQALDRHAHGGGFSTTEYARLTGGLPASARVKIVGDLTGVLSTPKTAQARRVPWVAALRGYAAVVSASSSQVRVSFRLDTGGAPLTAAELPFAPSAAPPQLAGSMPITVGFTDPAHSFNFIESAAQLSGSQGFAKYLGDQRKVKAKTGFDTSDLISQFTGNAIIESDTHTTIGRVQVADAGRAAKALAALARDPSDAIQSAVSVHDLGGGFYSLVQHTGPPITLGLFGGEFVAGRASVTALRAFATAPASAAPGSGGSLAFRIDLPQLLSHLLHPSGTSLSILTTVLSRLGAVTGSASNTAAALTGDASLALKPAG